MTIKWIYAKNCEDGNRIVYYIGLKRYRMIVNDIFVKEGYNDEYDDILDCLDCQGYKEIVI